MLIRRAAGDTIKHAGGLGSLAFVALGGLLSVSYTVATKGWSAVSWASVLPGIAISIGAGVVLFLINLACAPYRVERERRISLEARVNELQAELASADQPRFGMTIEELMFGGTAVSDGVTEYPVILTVSIRNTGKMPSILSQWKMFVRRADGRVDQLRVTHIYGPISIGTDKGQRITFSPTDFIYEKLAEPLPVGAYETGRIMGMSSDPNVGNLAERDEIVLQAKDVMNLPHEARRTREGANPAYEPMYYPRLRTQQITPEST